jgi:hypothetical protein
MEAAMKFRLRIALIAVLFIFALAPCSHAQLFGGRLVLGRNHSPWQPLFQPGPRRAPTYDEYYHYMNSHFPKYYGGFHANYFQSLGVPPGDVGLRGNGIFPSPW